MKTLRAWSGMYATIKDGVLTNTNGVVLARLKNDEACELWLSRYSWSHEAMNGKCPHLING